MLYIGPTQEYSSFDAIMIWIVDLQACDIPSSQRSIDVAMVCATHSKAEVCCSLQKGTTRRYLVNKGCWRWF